MSSSKASLDSVVYAASLTSSSCSSAVEGGGNFFATLPGKSTLKKIAFLELLSIKSTRQLGGKWPPPSLVILNAGNPGW